MSPARLATVYSPTNRPSQNSMVMADSVQKPLIRGPVRVGFYDIERTLGKGNFAVVKLARHRITKTEVSLSVNWLA